jgi:hypothetical protein
MYSMKNVYSLELGIVSRSAGRKRRGELQKTGYSHINDVRTLRDQNLY